MGALLAQLRQVSAHSRQIHDANIVATMRVLDSTARLLTAISAPQANEIERMKTELLRLRFDEQVGSERRKTTGTAIESVVTGGLKPRRAVVTPHKDVATGRSQQAEFAADLWQVHLGEGSDENRNPIALFRRTCLIESLSRHPLNALVTHEYNELIKYSL